MASLDSVIIILKCFSRCHQLGALLARFPPFVTVIVRCLSHSPRCDGAVHLQQTGLGLYEYFWNGKFDGAFLKNISLYTNMKNSGFVGEIEI